uniref:Transmembrane protein n=1 Tax=Heterorhabditis bacteriophora TaxID=37862 RepID=A0A1I7WLF7_HETBA
MAGCMLFDVFFGITYLSAGLWRATIVYRFDSKYDVSTEPKCRHRKLRRVA